MHISYQTDLNSMWDKIDIKSKNKIWDKKWEQEHIQRIVKDLIELKIKAKKDNNPILYNQFRISLIRAHEVQNDILEN
ncbi:hypothetical protein [Nitrosopumilus adriaticus]|uniref:Uncharacterized protein n=1 Tax=Nitrosopumilus adriaticus TaxID=1580092 RepID=A0A0D5C133_9ARCH|nr:hypothetical protein [Nitrosopumilus adriaticus]AJW70499.1 hypothetical protein NADRNF5_0805 [Nitrosopumilus adriaticus]